MKRATALADTSLLGVSVDLDGREEAAQSRSLRVRPAARSPAPPAGRTSKISKPAMSRMPRKEAPWRLVLSRALLTRDRIQRNRRSYVALAKASIAKSACSGRGSAWGKGSRHSPLEGRHAGPTLPLRPRCQCPNMAPLGLGLNGEPGCGFEVNPPPKKK